MGTRLKLDWAFEPSPTAKKHPLELENRNPDPLPLIYTKCVCVATLQPTDRFQ